MPEEKLKLIQDGPSKYHFKTKDDQRVSIEHKNKHIILDLFKWGEEASLQIILDSVPTPNHTFSENKIEVENPDFVIRVYPIDARSTGELYGDSDDVIQCEDGGLRFELVLKKKRPAMGNSFTFPVVSKNLRFSYQSFITPEEQEHGSVVKPFNVEGSYAVYHATKKNNQYVTGKAFHIYRPIAEDAVGNKAWCSLTIDGYTDPKNLTITIPQQFLDEATYPIVIDPDFGYSTIGSSSYEIANGVGATNPIRRGSAWPMPASGTANWLRARIYAGNASDTVDCKGAIYQRDSAGAGQHGLISARVLNLACAAAEHWEEFTMASEALTEAVNYILSVQGDGTDCSKNQFYYVKGDADGCVDSYAKAGFWAVTDDPWVDNPDATTIDLSIYCDYTLGVTLPTVTTQAVSNIGATTATGNGNITATGGENASAWGTCLATTANPDTGDTVDAGSGAGGIGAFTTSITGLTPGTLYHVRAYATNTAGTSYGADVTFITNLVLSDSVAISDSPVKVVSFVRALSDSVAIADALIKETGLVEADNLAIADSLTTKAIGVNKSDNVAIADSLAKVVDFVRALSDSVAITDALAKEVGLNKADSIAIADSLAKVVTFIRAFNDSVAIADSLARVVTFIRALNDSVAITDALAKEIGISLADAMAIADTLTTKAIGLNKADNVAIADSLARVVDFVRAYNDSVAIAESLTKEMGIAQADDVAIADAIIKAMGIPLTDSIAISESIVKTIELVEADSVTITDAGLVKDIGLSKAETVLITDVIVKSMALAEADSVAIADSIAKTIRIVETEAFALADTLVKDIGMSLAETIAVVDVFSRTVEYKRAFDDTIAMLDSIVITGSYARPGIPITALLFRRAIVAKLYNRDLTLISRREQ